jgi:hypothetical protein|nr:MAG TPA: hypothetical protein [Caudoviricetes sp.]
MSKILDDVKTTLDFASEEDTGFDSRLLLEIDGALGTLSQLTNVHPEVEVTKETTWDQLLHSSDKHLLRLVKQFIYISVRIVFDPPTGSVLTTLTTSLNNLSHRIIIQKEVYNAKPE